MKTIGNILWFLFTGIEAAIGWFILGILWCITIIGIPFGRQCFKFAKLSAFPFGKSVNENFGAHPIANVIWLLLGGLEMAIGFFFIGIIWCITIVGIPFGKQCFKLALLSLAPFGAQIRKG